MEMNEALEGMGCGNKCGTGGNVSWKGMWHCMECVLERNATLEGMHFGKECGTGGMSCGKEYGIG